MNFGLQDECFKNVDSLTARDGGWVHIVEEGGATESPALFDSKGTSPLAFRFGPPTCDWYLQMDQR